MLAMCARSGDGDGFPLGAPPATTATTAPVVTATAPGGTASPTTSTPPAPGGTGTVPGGGAGPSTTSPPAAGTSTTARAPGGAVATGVWGGRGIRLVVTATGGTVEYECAAGVIETPLALGAGGTFAASGSHAALSGGPASPGQPAPRSVAARYSGSVTGTQMRLTVTLETGATLGPYTLGLGEAPLLDRCG